MPSFVLDIAVVVIDGGVQRCHRVIMQTAGLGHCEEFLFSARAK
jgi:hypothetical protein